MFKLTGQRPHCVCSLARITGSSAPPSLSPKTELSTQLCLYARLRQISTLTQHGWMEGALAASEAAYQRRWSLTYKYSA